MLVTKLSKGKYANEGQLFAEVISDDNVKLMGEMIALQALRNVLPYDFEVVSKLYNGLIKDLNHISQIDYTITDGYDYAQTVICFLYQFKGMHVNDVYGKDKSGKYIHENVHVRNLYLIPSVLLKKQPFCTKNSSILLIFTFY